MRFSTESITSYSVRRRECRASRREPSRALNLAARMPKTAAMKTSATKIQGYACALLYLDRIYCQDRKTSLPRHACPWIYLTLDAFFSGNPAWRLSRPSSSLARTAKKTMSALTASASSLGVIAGPIAAAADAKFSGSCVVATDTSMALQANALARAWPVLSNTGNRVAHKNFSIPRIGSCLIDSIAFTVVPRIARTRSTKFTGGACRPAHA
jgi:hypothetical protein